MQTQNKTSKKKEEVKTAEAYSLTETILYAGMVDCPHCGTVNYIESEGKPPKVRTCLNEDCNKQFNIEWE